MAYGKRGNSSNDTGSSKKPDDRAGTPSAKSREAGGSHYSGNGGGLPNKYMGGRK